MIKPNISTVGCCLLQWLGKKPPKKTAVKCRNVWFNNISWVVNCTQLKPACNLAVQTGRSAYVHKCLENYPLSHTWSSWAAPTSHTHTHVHTLAVVVRCTDAWWSLCIECTGRLKGCCLSSALWTLCIPATYNTLCMPSISSSCSGLHHHVMDCTIMWQIAS